MTTSESPLCAVSFSLTPNLKGGVSLSFMQSVLSFKCKLYIILGVLVDINQDHLLYICYNYTLKEYFSSF